MPDQISQINVIAAINEGDIAEVRQFFLTHPDQLNDHVFIGGRTWVAYAASKGATEVVSELLRMGADINKGDSHYGTNSLHSAAIEGRVEAVDLLLNNGANIDTSESMRNPLFGSIIGRSIGVAKRLLDAGIDTRKRYVLGAESNPSLDAVAFAMMHGQREIAQLIALRNAAGDEAIAQFAMAEGLKIAEQATLKRI